MQYVRVAFGLGGQESGVVGDAVEDQSPYLDGGRSSLSI